LLFNHHQTHGEKSLQQSTQPAGRMSEDAAHISYLLKENTSLPGCRLV